MSQTIGHVTLVVRNYDEAIEFFTHAMGFELLEDTRLDSQKRWVLVGPKGSTGTTLLLAEAVTDEQSTSVGNQTGGRVFLFLQTDDFWNDYRRMLAAGVRFKEKPREENYGIVAVFEDFMAINGICYSVNEFLAPNLNPPSFVPFPAFW